MKIKSIKALRRLSGRRLLVRVDFNVPISAGRIKDDYKIKAGAETIKYLAAQKAIVIVATHLGDPAGRYDKSLSTAPLARRLSSVLGLKVKHLADAGRQESILAKALPGEIYFLENLRFNPGELSNDKAFAKQLASLADIYINDAFAVSHRDQASVSAVKNYLPAYAGLLLEQEVRALAKIVRPRKPLVAVMGGAKISTKAPIIANLYPVADYILLGGGLANNFWKFQGLEIGRSLCDQDSLAIIKKLAQQKKLGAKIVLPVDAVVKGANGRSSVKQPNEIKATDTILDIGPATIEKFASLIGQAKTVVWNGPLGKFEEEAYKKGTMAIAQAIGRQSSRAYGVVGGGETVEALRASGALKKIDWVSTAGGAMLSFLGRENMPGLKKIVL